MERVIVRSIKSLLPKGKHYRKLFLDRLQDVGRRDGYDALMMANKSRGKVISFECDHDAAEDMRGTFAQNSRLAIQVVESYVGEVNGPGYITIDRASRELFTSDVINVVIIDQAKFLKDPARGGYNRWLATYAPIGSA